MPHRFTGQLHFADPDDYIAVADFGFSNTLSSGWLMGKGPSGDEERYDFHVLIARTAPNGTYYSLNFFPYPHDRNVAVRLELWNQTRIVYSRDRTPLLYAVGLWREQGKRKDAVYKFIGLLEGYKADSFAVSETTEVEYFEALRQRRERRDQDGA